MDTQSTINDVAASIPGVVSDSFAQSDYTLTMQDGLLVERCGVKFISTGETPSLKDTAIVYCAITDRAAFKQAVATNQVNALIESIPATVLPGDITLIVMQAVKSAFKPVEDAQKKQREAALLNAAGAGGGSPSSI